MMGKQQKIIDFNKLRTSCKHCSLSDLCLPRGLDQGDLEQLDRVIEQKKPLHPGEHLFRQDLDSRAVYAVRSGAIKTYHITDDGTEQILGFHLPGELVGLDSLADNRHHCSAEALITTSVCGLPIKHIENLCHDLPGLQRQMLRIMSEEMISEHEMLALLGKKSAEERLATLLLSLSSRYQARGMSPVEFHLPMSRADIANYLGLTTETVSRLFSHFQEQGLLTAERKLITIHESERLRKLVSECVDSASDAVNE
jgi:CRP/FNR family transcriptional regulator